ncbi:conserved hypothetical protein [Burkholderia mallei PRL-20]|uniref:Uncharacterized protein n=1 Tax=Burkholderia mallei (strain NCTC 10229) TaxID=412022 RepID=A2SAH8_BURM9|nr:hypothetical protein BMASAVP1_A2282 [Burkholderia mallei SAVP1]ABN00615.1 hypothetical protein BMA10229_A3002 [Burkholderia mallei NCTC 10229]ABO06965.1 hypothetical protein BMA10247_1595 [Burkholderia mallei NCTC 10247]EDK56077.1 hypothetical protein BMAFMH_C0231 [Burkholderia mallei FMH]EDK60230.1 hypothetical protein BMAJHU_C0241 [Burkholderia mallei JHU]EDK85028.1 hypothetical protein BMA721280_A1247 [Burkholderia mallei 2002721280]EDP88672.1 hypothetical protein BMA10399_E0227 [Burkho
MRAARCAARRPNENGGPRGRRFFIPPSHRFAPGMPRRKPRRRPRRARRALTRP